MALQLSIRIDQAYSHLESGEYKKAIEILEKAAREFPLDPDVYAYLGEAYYLDKQFEKALNAFHHRDELLVSSHPMTAYIEGYRGCVFLHAGECEKAQPLLEKAVEQKVEDPEIHYSLGMLYALQGDRAKSQMVLKNIFALDPAFLHKKIARLTSEISELEKQAVPGT